MKPIVTLSVVAIAVAAALAVGYQLGASSGRSDTPVASTTTAPQETQRKVLYWYDPMTPGQRFDKPGKSPFMDMDLVPRYADETQDDGGITISARQQQNLGVKTAQATLRSLELQLNAFGTVATDERGIETISARANGLVEKLYVKAAQQFVQRNDPLAQLWMPQWSAAQQEYLAIRQWGDASLVAAARERLQLQFMPEEIVKAVERSGKPQTRITLRAPAQGYINKLDVREGAQVNAAQSLFELATLDPVWIVVDYPESQARLLSRGSNISATTDSWPGKTFHGKVDELLPNLETTTRTLKARLTLENPEHLLKPGMILNVALTHPVTTPPVVAIPDEALITTGTNNRVLLADGNGHFTPVDVKTGRSQSGWVEVTQGLKAGQSVVISGQFLIDSEASLKSALPQMADDQPQQDTPSAGPTPTTYSAVGSIEAIDGDTITISHGPVAALNWGPMTMDFVASAELRPSLTIGQQINFTFVLPEEGARLVSVTPVSNGNTHQHEGHQQ